MKLILVRHGLTDGNKEIRLQGWTDVPMNAEGIEQAKKVAERLKDEPLDCIYASPLQRALETAKIIASFHNLTPIPDERIKEQHFGEFEMARVEDVPWDDFPGDRFTTRLPGGESHEDMVPRVQSFLDMLKEKHEEETVLVVFHGACMKLMQHLLIPFDYNDINNGVKHNTAVSEYVITTENIEVMCMNCGRHLA